MLKFFEEAVQLFNPSGVYASLGCIWVYGYWLKAPVLKATSLSAVLGNGGDC